MINEPVTTYDYDVVVIGTGPIGQTLIARARAAGLSVAAVERELVGGECSYWACIPSKAMLRPVVAVADARRVDGARQAVSRSVHAPGVFARRDRFVTDWNDDGQAGFLKTLGAELVRGHGRLAGSRRVTVETPDGLTVTLTARHAVALCTGSRPYLPDLPGLPDARPWTNREATNSHTVPERLAVVGGGGVGVEMASAWSGLGATVTLLAQADGLLARMEPFAGEVVGRALIEAGVDVRIGATVTAVARRGDGPVTLTSTTATASRPTRCSLPPVGGRTPTTSAWRRWGSSPGPGSRSTTPVSWTPPTGPGSTPSVTSTATRCSPTRGSTKAESPAP